MNRKVVCMVRGGEAGRSTQEQAIAYAKKAERQLVFLQIINIDRLSLNGEEKILPTLTELTWLARINLSLARQRAARHGVKAEAAIKIGPIFESVVAYLKENQVERLFLGLPREDHEDYHFRLEQVNEFAGRISQATKVTVELVKRTL